RRPAARGAPAALLERAAPRRLVAPPASTHAARRPLITAWLHCLASLATGFASRPLEIPEGFLRVCVLARRRQRPPVDIRTCRRNHWSATRQRSSRAPASRNRAVAAG